MNAACVHAHTLNDCLSIIFHCLGLRSWFSLTELQACCQNQTKNEKLSNHDSCSSTDELDFISLHVLEPY